MFSLDSAEITALQQPVIDSRNFVWFTVKDRDTGDPAYAGFWSDAGPFTGNVKDALTGSTVSRTFAGAGLVSVGSIPRTVGLAVRRVEQQGLLYRWRLLRRQAVERRPFPQEHALRCWVQVLRQVDPLVRGRQGHLVPLLRFLRSQHLILDRLLHPFGQAGHFGLALLGWPVAVAPSAACAAP